MWVQVFAITLLVAGARASLLDAIGGIIGNTTLASDSLEGLFRIDIGLSDRTKLFLGYDEDTTLNFTQLTTKYGYEAAEFSVTTEDGFILSLFRLWASKCNSRGTPVLLMHGVLMSADTYISAGPGAGLGYLLADACHDVWIGNFRGTTYGRRHITLDPDIDAEFWEHSPDEMAKYDLPALIDTVLARTNYAKLNYIGFSQGGGTILMMCSENSEACAKVNVIIGLATATRMLHTRSLAMRLVFSIYNYLEDTMSGVNIYETLFKGGIVQSLLEFSCQMQGRIDILYQLCTNVLYILDSHNTGSITDETFKVLYSEFPGGVSVRTLARWGQMLQNNRLSKYDFGSEEKNLAAYNSARPPAYDLSQVTTPVAILIGADDRVVNPRDVLWGAAQLPQLLGVHVVEDPNWNHVDFMYSQKTPTFVLPTVLQYLAQYTTYD